MTPLVVRPAAQAAELVQLLRQHGHAPLCCPLLETVAGSELPLLPDLLRSADVVIAVSIHAVHFAHDFLLQTGQTWPHIEYFAVGQASADAFAASASRQVARMTRAAKGCWPCPPRSR